ncbi:MAG: hypothetical protein J5527_05235 [Treponema sp.]|nr:hypothetical protein [Treponema sp.]
MIIHSITSRELNTLKSLVGKKLICFKSQQKDSWNRIFGNILLVTEVSEVELRNELTEIEYFGNTEEVSKFYVNQITKDKPFKLMVEDSITETPVNEIIEDIIVIKDEIDVKDSSENSIYEITMDDAVIIKTDNSVYAISREWSLEEELIFIKTSDYMKDIYSVEQIVSEWSDEDEKTVATCNRKEISLKNS